MEVIDVEATDIDPLFVTKQSFLKPSTKQKTKSKDSKNDSTGELETSAAEVLSKLKVGCECSGNCFLNLNADAVYKHRLNIAELTKEEHDMYLMGVTMASLQNREQTTRNKERQRQRASYVYHGRRVCLDAFLYLENVSVYHLKIIRSHVMANGVMPRVHGNIGKKPHNSYSLDAYKCAETFVKQYLADRHFDVGSSKPIVIAGESRKTVYDKFKESGYYPNEKIMGFSTFRHFMAKQFPLVKFTQKTERDPKVKVMTNLSGTKEIVIVTRHRTKNQSTKSPKKIKREILIHDIVSDNGVEENKFRPTFALTSQINESEYMV